MDSADENNRPASWRQRLRIVGLVLWMDLLYNGTVQKGMLEWRYYLENIHGYLLSQPPL
jgi:hypothetical protein